MKLFFIFVLVSIMFSSCTKNRAADLSVYNGRIDLRKVDFTQKEVSLNGIWFQEKNSKKVPVAIPNQWYSYSTKEQHRTYICTLILPKYSPNLYFKSRGISSAYVVYFNGKKCAEIGRFAKNSTNARASYQPLSVQLPKTDSLEIRIDVSNFHHFKGGILNPPKIISGYQLQKEQANYSTINGILLGFFFTIAILFFMAYILMSMECYFLIYALWILVSGIHLTTLFDRGLFSLLGFENWSLAYKIELNALFIGFILCILFFNSFFENLLNDSVKKVLIIVVSLEVLFTSLAPAPWFTYIILLLPFNALLMIVMYIYLFSKANKTHKLDAKLIIAYHLILLITLIFANLFSQRTVEDIETIHYIFAGYFLGISLFLIKRIADVFKNEAILVKEVKEYNAKLEDQNKNLEEIVDLRTTQLLETEREKHILSVQKRERDIESLAANNLVKFQFTKNLIDELKLLPSANDELKPALNNLITKLNAHINFEERISVLQQDINLINTQFYSRLNEKYPNLSKTERELCAYIKLNLSNKDIAELRKTSLNTINVTRSRLRKKLGLERENELELFIQSF